MKKSIPYLFILVLAACASNPPQPQGPVSNGPPGTIYSYDWDKVKTLSDLKEILKALNLKLLIDPIAPPEKKKADEKLKRFVNIESGQLIPRQ